MKYSIQKAFLCSFFILSAWSAYGQNNTIDSLRNLLPTQKEDTGKVNTLIAIGKTFDQIGDNNNAMKYASDALALAEKINYKKGQANAYQRIGRGYDNQLNFTDARRNYSNALKIREEIGDQHGIAFSTQSIADTYSNQGNYPEALKQYYAALKLFEMLGDKENIAASFNSIGYIHDQQGNSQESLNNYLESLKIREELGNKPGIAQACNNIGGIYLKRGDYELALKNTFTGLKIFEELGDNGPNWGLPFSYICLGEIYHKQGDAAIIKNDKKSANINYNEALNNYLKSQKLFEKIGNRIPTASLNIYIGNIYRKQNSLLKARQYLENGLQQSVAAGVIESMKDGHLGLSVLDSIQGNWQQAYMHYKAYILFRDSLANDENTKKITMYKMQYEFDKKEALAKSEQEKQTILEQRNKNIQRFIMFSLLLLLFVSGLIAFLLYRNNRQKQKANNLLHRQKTEIDSQRDKAEKALSELKSTQTQLIQSEKLASLGELTAGIAHEIQNPLNFVNNFSELSVDLANELKLEIEKLEIPEKDKEYVSEILGDLTQNQQKINLHGKRAAGIVSGMLQHARTSTGTKEPTDLNALADEYLRLSYHGLRAKDPNFNATMVTNFDPAIGMADVIPQDMGRVLLNLINNAFYAVAQKKNQNLEGYEPTVTVSSRRISPETVEISIKDNGTGIPEGVKAKIFQPFFTTKPTGQGTGLGLSLAYDIVTKGHGGTMEVQTVEGQGTEFILHL